MHPSVQSKLRIQLRRYWNGIRHRLIHWLDIRLVRWYRLGDHQQSWYLKRLLSLLEIDLLIDVGGNNGQFAHFIRNKVGYRGHLITFEPIPELARRLQEQAKQDPNWTVVNAALGDKPGNATFNLMSSSPMSSLLKPRDDVTQRVSHLNTVRTTIPVSVLTLDGYLEGNDLFSSCKNIYLKLDVQGFEKRVLEGARASMQRIGALQAELSVIPIYQDQPDYKELMQYIDECGYLLSFIPAHNYEQFPEMIDFDCHFVQRERLALLGALRGRKS